MAMLAQEIRAQALRFALNCRPGASSEVHVTTILDPRDPDRLTMLVAEGGSGELMLLDVHAGDVLCTVAPDQPQGIYEALRRTAKLVYLDRHLIGPLRDALGRAG